MGITTWIIIGLGVYLIGSQAPRIYLWYKKVKHQIKKIDKKFENIDTEEK